jgi:acyl carrier protein
MQLNISIYEDLISWVCRRQNVHEVATGTLSRDEDLLGSGILDSLDFVRLISYIHENYGVSVDLLDDSKRITTIGGLTDYVVEAKGAG